MKTARQTVELRNSFYSEEEARGFARLLRSIHLPAEVRALVVNDKETCWWRVAVAKRSVEYAETLRAAWCGRAEWERQERDAERYRNDSEEKIERLRNEHVAVVGLTSHQRAFIEAARSGKASGWDFPSNAVASAKRLGYVRAVKLTDKGDVPALGTSYRLTWRTVYQITPEGEAALAADDAVLSGGKVGT